MNAKKIDSSSKEIKKRCKSLKIELNEKAKGNENDNTKKSKRNLKSRNPGNRDEE